MMGMVYTPKVETVATCDEAVENTTNTSTIATEVTTEPFIPTTEVQVATSEVEPENIVYEPVEYEYEVPTDCEVRKSDYDIDLLARVIYQEAGICGEYCQWLVGSTALNLADEYGGLEIVAFDYDKFNVAYVLYDATPSDLSYQVARRLLSGDRDYAVKAFRSSYYHDFGTPYTNVDNIYFSSY